MSLNESIVEDAMKMVKSKIGRVKFQSPFPISLFTLHSFLTLATLRGMLLPKLPRTKLGTVDFIVF